MPTLRGGMNKKWYSYFVVSDDDSVSPPSSDADGAQPAGPQRVSDIAPESPGTDLDAREAAATVDLAAVYEAAKIAAPAHGYTVLKVAEMLDSEHIRTLPPDVKRKSVMVALDAARVKITEIVEDAVRRDRALDTYEKVLSKSVDDLRAETAADNQRIEQEIATRVAELRAQIDENNRKMSAEERELAAWRARKHREEEVIATAVGYFTSENPITAPARAPQGDADVR